MSSFRLQIFAKEFLCGLLAVVNALVLISAVMSASYRASAFLANEGLAATGSAIKPVRAIPDACEDIPRDGARLFG